MGVSIKSLIATIVINPKRIVTIYAIGVNTALKMSNVFMII